MVDLQSGAASPVTGRPGRRAEPPPGATARLVFAAMAVAAAVALVWALWLPPVRDLAGHALRVELVERDGLGLWNNAWYAGHHTPAYSVVFPPVADLLGLQATGVLAAVVAAGCFAALLAGHVGPRLARAGALWFGAATATSLFTGRVPFALGCAWALAACLALQRGRTAWSILLAAATAATSGVAAAFLVLAGGAVAAGGSTAPARRRGLAVAVATLVTLIAINAAFPEGGDARFGPITLLGALVGGTLIAVLAPRRERVLRAGAALYLGGVLLAALVPNPLGGNLGRLATLLSGPLAVTLLLLRARSRDAARPRRSATQPLRTAAIAVGLVALAVWQWGAARLDVTHAMSERIAPWTRASTYAPLLAELERRADGPVRVEIPLTRSHWEVTHVALRFPIARGWQRQLDRDRNRLFYKGALTAARYREWLRDTGVTWVALPEAPLDYSAVAEARLIRGGLPYLREQWRSPRWRLFAVEGATGLVSGPGRLIGLSARGFTVRTDRPGRLLVRVRHTRYWAVTAGEACVVRAPGGWTEVRSARRQTVAVTVRLGPVRRLGGHPGCA